MESKKEPAPITVRLPKWAKRLGVDRRTATRWATAGDIKAFKKGRAWYVYSSELENFPARLMDAQRNGGE